MYSGYGIIFDSADPWGFDNDTANETFDNNSSSSHTENCKNNLLVLGEGLTFRINGSFCSPKKKFNINFSKTNTKFCLSLHYNADSSNFFVNGK